MLYYLFDFLDKTYDLSGAGVFQYLSFRGILAVVASLLIAMAFGKFIIRWLQKMQLGEVVRDLGLEGQTQKQGTPTMGGIIIIASVVLPTLLFAKLNNVYILLMLVSTIWMGLIGFLDDYIKTVKQDKKGLHGWFKVIGQVSIGLLVGLTLYYNDHVRVRHYENLEPSITKKASGNIGYQLTENGEKLEFRDTRSQVTTIPFFKNNEFNYHWLGKWGSLDLTPVIYVLVVIFVITAVSNGANITDGIDGLAAGTSAIIGFTLAVLAYVSGNLIFSEYLNIMYIPDSGELVIFCGAFVGACVGFLWFNSFPAQVFMGDTGSLSIGTIIAVLALSIRKELLIPLLCGVFLIENLSVVLQVGYFKYTKKRWGEGKRIFRMAPLHHHYQMKPIHEAKIVTRFWIVGILLALATLGTLKLR